ncbi:MAG: hypothetical protein JO119_13835 [Acidobacteria bacterium]|nr:hypothetical protein [Acidobacteriota bacterium]
MRKPLRSIHAAFRTLPHLFICVLLIGCAPRKPVTSPAPPAVWTDPAFHLKSVKGTPLLLSPNVPYGQPLDTSISFTLAANSEVPATSHACSIMKGMFRLERDSNDSSFRVVMAPPDRWLSGPIGLDEMDVMDVFYSFLAAVDQAELSFCFAPSDTAAHDYILQNVPTLPSDSLFNAYGYRIERSGVNLKPNLRLKVQRAYFNGAERSDKNYVGLSDAFFDVTTNPDGLLRFQQAQPIHYSPDSLSQTDQEGSRDLAILDLKPQKHYRVLFYTHQVPTDQNFTAAIIGADDFARLDQFEQSMRADARASCSPTTGEDIECMEFRGFVTVSIQIPIELNGKSQFVDWATKVKGVIPAKAAKTLKIQRRFANSYFDIQFDRDNDAILDLALVGGDRLMW